MGDVFTGSHAVRSGQLSAYQLRSQYRALYPDVYVPALIEPSLITRTVGAWLWSEKRAVVAGLAAAALHGAQWIDDDECVELVWRNPHAPEGVQTRNERLADDEITRVDGLAVTTPARTAYDLGRRLPRSEAIARLDALMYATPFASEDVLLLAKRHRGARGLRRLRTVLPLVDGGAASPRESWLRTLFVDAGLPRPTTQVPVVEARGRLVRMLDMGWEDFMVAAEYDGDQHRTNRQQYVKDIRTLAKVERLGWQVVRVVKEDRPDEVVARARAALIRRGYRDI
ncbi:MAG: hypothetical protein ACRDU5_03580 [Mycobacterium sp.]